MNGVAGLSGVAGTLTAPIAFILPAYLILVTSGLPAMLEVWPAVLTCGAVFATIHFFVSNYIGPQLTDILSSIGAMGALVLLLRFWEPKHTEAHDREVDESMKMVTDELPLREHDLRSGPHYTTGQIWAAWMPYALLVIFVLAWGFPPFAAMLNRAIDLLCVAGAAQRDPAHAAGSSHSDEVCGDVQLQLDVGFGNVVHVRVAAGGGLCRDEAERASARSSCPSRTS